MTFKKILTGAGFAALLGSAFLGTTSCQKDFIDLNDPTRIPTSETYQDSSSIATGVTAAYSSLQDIYGKAGSNIGLFVFSEVPSDNSQAVVEGQGLGEFDYFSITSANGRLQSQWTVTYRGIARCNIIISRAPGVKLTTALRNRYIAEMKFIRALEYFNAVQIWGDIPLVTTEISTVADAYTYGRKPVADVYAQIEKDLTEAAADLPNVYPTTTSVLANANPGRATKGAARALLAKVYLTEKKYPEAQATLQSFLTDYDNATNYRLLPNYADIFAISNELNAEIIFAVRYSKGGFGTGSPFTNYFAPLAAQAGGGQGFQYNSVRKDLVDAFTASGAADTRYNAELGGPVTVGGASVYYTKKYFDTPTTVSDADNDWIVLRFADVLLMYAEVLNELNRPAEAVPYVNRTRVRAGLTGLATTLDQATLRLAIENERRLELNMEGHRWFDLVRTGRAYDVMNAHFTKYNIRSNGGTAGAPIQLNPDKHQLLFPIPIQEIQTNPIITQNPGY
ncbi:RagB/SusD family nutrient uptake outer membrane protein [Hymenobacter rubidus]|uniref:RagB/SusD family nutrient uptake outer membrane protein n=1 Tax=Hymenobacter rubidus TaxID=1441626 RepID=UPI00191CC0A5|nr:RagB/SusD family nutrient uptake outer membrane protein [Hymenobacter rubidus]